jgi:hypothetical protein
MLNFEKRKSDEQPVDMVEELKSIIASRNEELAKLEGGPSVSIVTDRSERAEAASVMAKAFVGANDMSFLNWLSPRVLRRLEAGDSAGAERRIARVIRYLLASECRKGGVVLAEYADNADGERTMRGAALRLLPIQNTGHESVLYKYVAGGVATLPAYGARLFDSDEAYMAMKHASDAAYGLLGLGDNYIENSLIGVDPAYQGNGVYSHLTTPINQLADMKGLPVRLESSNPEQNDARVFAKSGFERYGEEHVYDKDNKGSIGSHVVRFMVRRPNTGAVEPKN